MVMIIPGPYLRYMGVIQAWITARRCCLSGSIGTGVAVGGARFVRPRRHRVYNTRLVSHVSTTNAIQRFPTHQLHRSRSSLDREPRRRTGIETYGRSVSEGGGCCEVSAEIRGENCAYTTMYFPRSAATGELAGASE